ncbi:segregation/condensation protein A [Leptotrichia shahii]|uniref:segregation and condensation protein A n=1 Tax=Leptotrichia shahii TaxID=157691 RepID=UPI0028D798F1|nr:segregation/condensation protein A [Leptotrichia shahii]
MENVIQIKIENFEGPLDLLIHLIEKKKMDINSINISQIIDDYLNYIHNVQKELNLKIKVEFLIMATDLIEIKAYSVLNRDNKKFEKIENLEKKIIEYQLFKEISELFSKYENEYNVPYTRTGTESIGNEIIEYDISRLNLDNLFKSLKNLINSKMVRKDNLGERMILNLEDDNYSTEEAYNEISEIIKEDRKVEFNHLLKNKFSKSRIVTLFLCILDMFKNGEIDIIVEEKNFFIKSIKS